jgi:hypothetical protein
MQKEVVDHLHSIKTEIENPAAKFIDITRNEADRRDFFNGIQ